MGKEQTQKYYEARGFSTYYFANAIFNIVKQPMAYCRGIEAILGDAATSWFMEPFKKFTNLHEFVTHIVDEILVEEDKDQSRSLLEQFFEAYLLPFDSGLFADDRDEFLETLRENSAYHDAVDALTEEVFHVLFNDVGFLAAFNKLCAGYFSNDPYVSDPAKLVTKTGTLRRIKPPAWVRTAIFHRDKGECRECKKSLARLINQIDLECYDHIIPLASFGANDVTNLQLLCHGCNSRKRAKEKPVSSLYPKAIQV